MRVARLESGEDADRGRQARKTAPRSSHGEWAPAPDRPDPVHTLRVQAESRLPQLVPIRYGRMLVSPFTFYRGAAAVMARDLARTPSSGLVVQACGDAHISNFGGFAAPDRHLLFGPNDFDETLPGPWEWDIKRMAASIEIAGRDIDLPAGRRSAIVDRVMREYREAMLEFSQESMLQAWYERLDADELTARFGTKLDADSHELFTRTFEKGRRKTNTRAVSKLTDLVDGKLRFTSAPPLLTPLHELLDADPTSVRHSSVSCSSSTSTACTPIASTSSVPTPSPTWPARWSESGASAPGHGSSCLSVATVRMRSSSRPRRPRRRCSSRFSAGVSTRRMASGSCAGSA